MRGGTAPRRVTTPVNLDVWLALIPALPGVVVVDCLGS
jgi:hypothetical protein